MINMTFSNETADGILEDLKRIFPHLVAGTSLPPMQEQPKENREAPSEEEQIPRDPPKERKPRAKKEDAKEPAGEPAPGAETVSSGASAPEASVGQAAQASAAGAASGAEVPDIEVLRAKLKQLGATDGLGHDKVFELLGTVKATNASTVPPEKRADLIAAIDEALAGAAK